LFGPGVIAATNANAASAQRISGWMVSARAPACARGGAGG
jgi:hypothetical protein